MKTIFKVSLSLIAFVAFSFIGFAQDFSSGQNHATESYGQVNFPRGGGLTITHSVDPDSVFLNGSLSCRTFDSVTVENHYYRSFELADFGITNDYNVSLVDIGIQEALGPNGGVQPMTCNLYITDGTPFPVGFPNSLTLIGTTTLDVPDQAGTHFPIAVSGTAPFGSELVVEISIPDGNADLNKFFIGINDFGETAPSYVMAPGCGFSVPTPVNPVPPPIPEQDYVMSVTGNETVPVELTSFTANVNREGNVLLNWITATEVNNQMFEIERKSDEGQYSTIGYVEGNGTTTEPQEYSYTDNTVETGIYNYRLKQIDFGGRYEYSDEIEVEVNGPLTFALEQNYPNPFNPSTSIKYSVPENGFVNLSVYNLVGEEISVLVNETVDAGFYEVSFNASSLPSGTYFYRLQAGSFVETKKMILLK